MDITEKFCIFDDFCNKFDLIQSNRQLSNKVQQRKRKCKLSISEVMTILVEFHSSSYRNFKHYYLNYVGEHLSEYFPNLVSYNRFVELTKEALTPLLVFMQYLSQKNCSGITFVDSTPLKVCHNRRIHSNKTFKGIAERGKSSTGWFFGFKLHLTVSDTGEIISFMLTPGNIDDRNTDILKPLYKDIFGKLIGDKGYISQKLTDFLAKKNIQLITKIKKNMKNKLMSLLDKALLRKRAVIETVNDQLKNISQIEHTRHRSFDNFVVNLVSGLIAYSFKDKKPSIYSKIEEKYLLENL